MNKKKYYSINEISHITGLPAHTIRYWEKDFNKYLNPFKTPGGQRRYSEEHIINLDRIKTLRYEEKYTIAGALKEMDKYENENMRLSELAPENINNDISSLSMEIQ